MIDNQKQSGKRRGRGGRGVGGFSGGRGGGGGHYYGGRGGGGRGAYAWSDPSDSDDMTPRYVQKNEGGTSFGPQAIVAPKPLSKQKATPLAKTLPEVRVALTQGVSVFGPRVAQLLAGRPHGLFKAQVEKMYEKKWSERLPGLWEEVMESGGWGMEVGRVGSRENPVCTMVGGRKVEHTPTVVQHQLEQAIKATISNNNCNGVEKIDTADWLRVEQRIGEILSRRVHGWFGNQVTYKVGDLLTSSGREDVPEGAPRGAAQWLGPGPGEEGQPAGYVLPHSTEHFLPR